MAAFLKDYGALIGPVLGFLIGLLALLCHRWINDRLSRRDILRSLRTVCSLIESAPPPHDSYSQPPPGAGYTAAEARDRTSLNRLQIEVIGIRAQLATVSSRILELGDVRAIRSCARMEWLLNKVVESVSELVDPAEDEGTDEQDDPTARDAGRRSDYGSIWRLWDTLAEEAKGVLHGTPEPSAATRQQDA